jgi:argininosuccinate lyase
MKVLNSEVNQTSSSELYNFTQGIDVDQLLYRQEIQVQVAWVLALHQAGYLSEEDSHALHGALLAAQREIQEGTFPWRIEDEDIHMNLERYVTDVVGAAGEKLHYGRSRNDLIATTLRLFVAESIDALLTQLAQLGEAIKAQSHQWIDVVIPGMTHLQAGQPIRLGHSFAAHGWALLRDYNRLKEAKSSCLAYMPLGAAAFAGTHVRVDLDNLRETLGFGSVLHNSYDAVGDRDFILASLNDFALCSVHVSRFCEEVMFWSSSLVGLMSLPPSYSTGSSIMPNKRNPDVLELARAKMARVMSCAQEGMILVRAVNPSYGSDLHELKRTYLLAYQELSSVLSILQPFVDGLKCQEGTAKNLLGRGHILATEVANHLTEKGTSFRQAYTLSAQWVAEADRQGQQIHEVSNTPYEGDDPFVAAVERRQLSGGTSAAACRAALERLVFSVDV